MSRVLLKSLDVKNYMRAYSIFEVQSVWHSLLCCNGFDLCSYRRWYRDGCPRELMIMFDYDKNNDKKSTLWFPVKFLCRFKWLSILWCFYLFVEVVAILTFFLRRKKEILKTVRNSLEDMVFDTPMLKHHKLIQPKMDQVQ